MGINGSLLGDNSLVVFPTNFNLNNPLLKLFEISLLLRFNPALTNPVGLTLFLCIHFILFK